MSRALYTYSLTEEEKRLACRLAAEGKPIQAVCEAIFVDLHTFWQYRLQDIEFAAEFARARDEGLDSLADGLIGITDRVPDVQRARLESENTRWLLSKRKASVYGDRVAVDVTHTVNLGDALAEARSRVAARPIRDLENVQTPQLAESTESCIDVATGAVPVAEALQADDDSIFS